jgi:hypothetical protein
VSALTTSLLPAIDEAINLGSASKRFAYLFATGIKDGNNLLRLAAGGGQGNAYLSNVLDSGAAVAHTFNTDTTFSTSGAKLASFKNNGTEKAYFEKDGSLRIDGGFVTAALGFGNSGNGAVQGMSWSGSNTAIAAAGDSASILLGSNTGLKFATLNSNGIGLGTSSGTALGLSASGSSLIVRGGQHIYIQPAIGGAGTGAVIFSPGDLPTCAAGIEGAEVTLAGGGGTRTKRCQCGTSDGSAFSWQNLATQAIGTTTTCG